MKPVIITIPVEQLVPGAVVWNHGHRWEVIRTRRAPGNPGYEAQERILYTVRLLRPETTSLRGTGYADPSGVTFGLTVGGHVAVED